MDVTLETAQGLISEKEQADAPIAFIKMNLFKKERVVLDHSLNGMEFS